MTALDIIGLVIGLLYLYYEYKASRIVWLLGVIMPINSLFVYYGKGLYADFGINIFYLVIALYGWIHWSRHKPEAAGGEVKKAELPVTHTPGRAYAPLAGAFGVLWLALWWLLTNFTDSTVPVPDAFTTALSIVAYWMMARKWAEQWLAWLVVDAVCVGLYVYKGLVFYPLLYGVYTVVAWFGYRKWCRLAATARESEHQAGT